MIISEKVAFLSVHEDHMKGHVTEWVFYEVYIICIISFFICVVSLISPLFTKYHTVFWIQTAIWYYIALSNTCHINIDQ